MTRNLLFSDCYRINDFIKVVIPTVGEVLRAEDGYYSMISAIVATPYDMMVQLDDVGIEYTTIDDYDLFLMTIKALQEQDTSLIFGDLNLRAFKPAVNEKSQTLVLYDADSGTIIDRAIHFEICQAIRQIHHLKRNYKKPGNKEALNFMLRRARDKMRRQKKKVTSSQLEELIVALVNTEQFGYGFEDVKTLTIYQFNESVHQIVKKIDFDNKMNGIYSGTVSAKDLNPAELNWLTNKN